MHKLIGMDKSVYIEYMFLLLEIFQRKRIAENCHEEWKSFQNENTDRT